METREKIEALENLCSKIGVPMYVNKAVESCTVTTYFMKLYSGADILKLNKAKKAISANFGSVQYLPCESEFNLIVRLNNATRKFYKYEQNINRISLNNGDMWLGLDTMNKHIVQNIKSTKSMFIAGSTGGGKSSALNTIINSMLLSTPKLLPVFIDPKKVELMPYGNLEDIKKRGGLAVDTVAAAEKVLSTTVNVTKDRYKALQECGLRTATLEQLRPIVIFIDELAQLNPKQGTAVYEYLNTLLSIGRAANVYVIAATQVPKVIDTALRCNCPSVIALRCQTVGQSVSAIGSREAVDLLGYGDGLLQIDGKAKNIRTQFPLCDDVTFNELYLKGDKKDE